MTRIEYLKRAIAEADRAYWAHGESDWSDAEYDAMKEELRCLTGEEEKSFGTPEVLSSGKVKHLVPMLSMQKVYSIGEVVSWAEKYAHKKSLIVMPKYDGIALVKYPDGTIATRGDGKCGEDVTELASSLLADSKPGYGELVCKWKAFEALKELGYKNPRNAVSGIVNAKVPEIRARIRHLTFAPYTQMAIELSAGWTAELLESAHRNTKDMSVDYPTDGVVFRIADEPSFQALGHTDHHWRGQIALKDANERATSTIREIVWQEKNGTITPVALIDPVELGGATLSRVTLHNVNWVKKWDARIGDTCVVERAGGVIPKIICAAPGPDWDARPLTRIPSRCPTCGGALAMEGARLYCGGCDK